MVPSHPVGPVLRSSLVVALLAACVPDAEPDDVFVDPRSKRPEISVSPALVDFGEHAYDAPVEATVKLANTGFRDARIEALEMAGATDFEVLPPTVPPFNLPSETSIELTVRYTPVTDGPVQGTLEVVSPIHDPPRLPVDLTGTGLVPILEVDPPEIAFGEDGVGCDDEAEVTLRNVGSWPLEVDEVLEFGTPGLLRLRGEALTGVTLAPNASSTIDVTYRRDGVSFLGHSLVVRTDAPTGEERVVVTGSSFWGDDTTESFLVPDDPSVTLLIAVDQSLSMAPQKDRLANAFDGFISVMEQATRNWRVGVTTGTPSCLRGGGWLTADTPNWDDVFRQAVRANATGETEGLLRVAHAVMWGDRPDGCNEGFLVDDTQVHVVIFSDERDQSAGWLTDPLYWIGHLDEMAARLGPTQPFTYHAIVDRYYTPGCGGGADGARGYAEAVAATGGHLGDICTPDWVDTFLDIADQVVEDLLALDLSTDDLDPDSLRVTVDGVPAEGWSYDAEGPRVTFDDPPPPGSLVEVTYGRNVCGG